MIGRGVLLDGRPREIIGVLPDRFRFLDQKPSFVLPIRFDRGKTRLGQFNYTAVARLKEGTSVAQASADVARMIPMALQRFPVPRGFHRQAVRGRAHHSARATSQGQRDGRHRIGPVGAHGDRRRRAPDCLCERRQSAAGPGRRASAGARRPGGARRRPRDTHPRAVDRERDAQRARRPAGPRAFVSALRLLQSMAPANLPRLDEIGIDGSVLLFTVVVSLAAGLLFGGFPR